MGGLLTGLLLASGLWVGAAHAQSRTQHSPRAETAPTEYKQVNGTAIAYRRLGPAQGAVPLVLLQRFRGTLDDWDPLFLNELARNRPVIIFNNVGVATSSGQVPASIQQMAGHAADVVRALGYRQADVLGWSMGGLVAQALALDHPTLVRKVVLVGSGPAGSQATPLPEKGVFDVATKPTYNLEDHQYLFFTPTTAGKTAAQASLKRIQASRGGRLEPATSLQVMQAQGQAIQEWLAGKGGYFERLPKLQQPVLILNGDRDRFFPAAGQTLLYGQLPHAQLALYPMAGHGVHHQFPELAARTIHTFLQ